MIASVRDIKRARKAAGWTQRELADATNLSQSAIAKIESGSYNLSHETFLRISDVLNRLGAESDNRPTLGNVMATSIITLSPEEPVERAASLMDEHSISQIPIFEGNVHIGTVTSTSLVKALTQNPDTHTVRKAMIRELPMLNEATPIDQLITGLLEEFHAILVTRSGEVVGIVTSEDVLKRFVRQHYNV